MLGVKRCTLRVNANVLITSRSMAGQPRPIANILKVARSLEFKFTKTLSNKELYAQAMWNLVENKKYDTVANGFELTPRDDPVHSVSATHAAMFVSAEKLLPWKTKEIMDQIPQDKIRTSTVGLMLHSYATSDRLGSAERLLHAYLDRYLLVHPDDALTRELQEQLKESSGTAKARTAGEVIEFGESKVGNRVLPLSGWVAMMIIYGKRNAWRQCLDILTYLEAMRGTTATYRCNASQDVILQYLDELQYPTFMVSSDYCRVFAERAAVLNSNSGLQKDVLNADQVTALQWNVLYHLTLRALCQSHQFPHSLDVLKRMRAFTAGTSSQNSAHNSSGVTNSVNNSVHNHNSVTDAAQAVVLPQLPAVISLMRALLAPIAPLQGPLHTSGAGEGGASVVPGGASAQLAAAAASLSASKIVPGTTPIPVHSSAADPVHGRVLQRQQIAASLRHDMTRVIKTLATPRTHSTVTVITAPATEPAVSAKESSEHFSSVHSGVDSGVKSDSAEVSEGKVSATARVGEVANTLAREYVILLCKLDLMNEAKLFISDVMNHILAVRFGGDHSTSTTATTGTAAAAAAETKAGNPGSAGNAGSAGNKQPSVTDVRGFHNETWISPYLQHLRQRGEWEECDVLYNQLLEAADYEDSVRRANPAANKGVMYSKYKNPKGVKQDKVVLPAKGRKTTMYHDATRALREAGEIGKLTDLMLKHKI